VIGVSPDPASSEGVLTRHSIDRLPRLLKSAAHAERRNFSLQAG